MNIKTKVTALLTAVSLATSAMLTFPMSMTMTANASEVAQWAGHEKKDEQFDTWDGTFDTSWLSEHTGDENDPFIIDSAEDWATLAFLTGGHAIDYDNPDEVISTLDINTSSTLTSNIILNSEDYNGEEYVIRSHFGIREYMSPEQLDTVLARVPGTSVEVAAPHITKLPIKKSADLYFKDSDGSIYYTQFDGGENSYLSVDITPYVKIEIPDDDNYAVDVTYRLYDNVSGSEIAVSGPYRPLTQYQPNGSAIWKTCYNYDWNFFMVTKLSEITLNLYSVDFTVSFTDLTKGPWTYTDASETIELPISLSPEMFTYYDANNNAVDKIPSTSTYIGKGSEISKMKYNEIQKIKTFISSHPSEYSNLCTIAASIDKTFANKVIKFENNVDFSNGISAFKDGLAGTIDFNSKAFIGPEANAIIKATSDSILKNGVLISSSENYSLIGTDEGLIKDCDLLRKNCFFNNTGTPVKVPNMIGTANMLESINFYNYITEGCLLSSNASTIKDSSMLVINGPLVSGVNVDCGLANTVATVSNCEILADSEIIGSEEYPALIQYCAFGRNTTNIEDCYADDFSIYCNSGSSVIASQIQNVKNIECYTDLLGDVSNRGLWQYPPTSMVENAIINCKFEGTVNGIGSGNGWGQGTPMKNCTVVLDVQRFRNATYLLGQGENCYIDITFHDIDGTTGNLTSITSGTFKDSFIRLAPAEGCDKYISAGSGADLYNLDHCYVELLNVNLPGTMPLNWGCKINDSYFKLKTTETGHYGLCLAGSNSYFDIEFEGGKTPFIGMEYGSSSSSIENSFIHVNYKGDFTPKTYASSVSNNIMKNCVYMLTIDDTSTGCISTGLNNFQTVENSFIFVDEFPDDCYMTMHPLIPEYTYAGHYTNSTFIMPKLNWGNNKSFGISPCNTPTTGTDFHDVYAYMNVYPYQSDSNIPNSAIMVSGGLDNLIYNVSMEVNFFDLVGNTADIPVRFCQNLTARTAGLDGICFKTNVKDAAVFDSDTTGYGAYLLGDNPGFVFKNIYLDVPNGSLREDIKSGLMAAFPSSDTSGPSGRGSVNSSYYQYAGLATLGYHILNDLGYDVSNILIPEGQSVYYQRYLDDPARIDSENIPAYINQFYYNSGIAPAPGLAGDWDYSIDPNWVTRVNNEHISSAEIAYLLDRGSTATRTTNWTVLEDITICAPDTGEVLFTIPKHVDLTTTPYFESTTPFLDITKIPTEDTFNPISTFALGIDDTAAFYNTSIIASVNSLSGELEQSPIYKYTITNDGNGEISGTAFNRSEVTDGTIFAKAGVALLGEASPQTGYVLSSVTENGTTITSTDPGTYTVNGYRAPANDATIVANFLDATAEITQFDLPNPDDPSNPFVGVINQTQGLITITIPDGLDVTNVLPIITWQGASLTPNEGVAQDFSSTITYTVQALAGNTKSYDINVIVQQPQPSRPTRPTTPTYDNTAIITSFKAGEYTAVIEQNGYDEHGTITLSVPDDFDVSSVAPVIVWRGERITPREHEVQDLTGNVIYEVVAESGRKKSYDVTVKYIPKEDKPQDPIEVPPVEVSDVAIITRFVVKDCTAKIEQNGIDEKGIITLIVPIEEDLSSVIPEIDWEGYEIMPGDTLAQDFTTPISYTVVAESGRTKVYDVKIVRIPNDVIDNPDTGFTSIWDVGRVAFLIFIAGGVQIFIYKKKKWC